MRKISANENVMTTREAGEVLGVAVRTVQLWVEAGILPAWRTAGGHRRIARSAVDKLLTERESDLAPVESRAPLVPASLKLLLVEGSENLVKIFSEVVAGWGFPVDLRNVPNGLEALLQIGVERPDVLVTDLVMSGIDGVEMLRALARPAPGLPAINLLVITALSSAEINARGGLPDGVIYFQKPVNYIKLEAMVHQCFLAKLKRTPAR